MKYKWIAKSNDGSFEDESALFETEKECYNDMRNAVFEKMKWNTEYDEDFHDILEDEYIRYAVKFNQRKITHDSYSGLYTYEIVEIDEMKTLELTKDACRLIADALEDHIREYEIRNDAIQREGVNDVAQKYIDKNNIKIGELKTLLDYIKTDL